MKNDLCEFCDGAVEESVTRVAFNYRKEIHIDNVPVRLCRKCGEVYFEASVYKQLERIAEGPKQIKSISFR
jgi:YgiT-type zinc finger domain-containing protein